MKPDWDSLAFEHTTLQSPILIADVDCGAQEDVSRWYSGWCMYSWMNGMDDGMDENNDDFTFVSNLLIDIRCVHSTGVAWCMVWGV